MIIKMVKLVGGKCDGVVFSDKDEVKKFGTDAG